MSDDEFQRRVEDKLVRSGLMSSGVLLAICVMGWGLVVWFWVLM